INVIDMHWQLLPYLCVLRCLQWVLTCQVVHEHLRDLHSGIWSLAQLLAAHLHADTKKRAHKRHIPRGDPARGAGVVSRDELLAEESKATRKGAKWH
ncbi:hypothetical protein GOODEAATRI_018595, partial [Goodea atripinnis]